MIQIHRCTYRPNDRSGNADALPAVEVHFSALGVRAEMQAPFEAGFLSGELLIGKLGEAVVVVGNAPHDRPEVLVGHRQPCELPLHESANAQGPRRTFWPSA